MSVITQNDSRTGRCNVYFELKVISSPPRFKKNICIIRILEERRNSFPVFFRLKVPLAVKPPTGGEPGSDPRRQGGESDPRFAPLGFLNSVAFMSAPRMCAGRVSQLDRVGRRSAFSAVQARLLPLCRTALALHLSYPYSVTMRTTAVLQAGQACPSTNHRRGAHPASLCASLFVRAAPAVSAPRPCCDLANHGKP